LGNQSKNILNNSCIMLLPSRIIKCSIHHPTNQLRKSGALLLLLHNILKPNPSDMATQVYSLNRQFEITLKIPREMPSKIACE